MRGLQPISLDVMTTVDTKMAADLVTVSTVPTAESENPAMPLDETDRRLGEQSPDNSPERRARRIVNSKIADLERELEHLKFVRDVLDTHIQ